MNQDSIIIKSVPTGLVNDILNLISLAGETHNTLYQNDDADSYTCYSHSYENFNKVNMIVEYNIESDLSYGFKSFVQHKVESMIEKYHELNKSWRLEVYDKRK